MIVIADSGSTKTDWKIIENQQIISSIQTIGFNPILNETPFIISELQKSFINTTINGKVKEVYYYGAGCWNLETCLIVKNALVIIFPKAEIEVTNDLLGAARAVCGKEAGIISILGTGANSCLYDGKTVLDNIPALGYIIGDEGSGAFLGKKLIQSYFYRELPIPLKEKLEIQYEISKKSILENVYGQKNGNRYLATYARFLIAEKRHPFTRKIIAEAFDTFIKRQVLKYKNAQELPIHFIGSIAFFLKDILIKVVEQNQLIMGNVIRQPIDSLVEFHLNNGQNG